MTSEKIRFWREIIVLKSDEREWKENKVRRELSLGLRSIVSRLCHLGKYSRI